MTKARFSPCGPFGKLAPTHDKAATVLRTYLKGGSDQVRQAAGSALADLAASASEGLGSPVLGINAMPEGSGFVVGAGAAFVALRAQVEAALKDNPTFEQFNESASRLLSVSSVALKDEDDRVKASGADAVLRIAQAVSRVIPDSSLLSTDSKPDPLEMKLKWFLLAPRSRSAE